MKKILIVTKHFKYEKIGGGAQKSIECLVENLKDDFKINVVCRKTNSESNIVKKFKYLNTKYYSQFDLFYLNSFFSPLTIYFLLLYNSRCLISPKGELYEGALANKYLKKIIWIKAFNVIFKRKILFHATSKEEEIIINKHVESKKIYIAPDIIKLDFSGFKKTNKTLKVVFVSRIELKKNLSFCIDVLSKIKRDISFEIYGDIGDKNYFNYCISELKKLPQNISYSYNGVLKPNQVKNVFLNADLFFFPTLGENFGYIILESLSSYCFTLLSKGTTIFDNLNDYKIGINIDLNSDIYNWVNFIEEFKANNSKEDLVKYKNYLCNRFDEIKIIQSNKKLFNEIFKG